MAGYTGGVRAADRAHFKVPCLLRISTALAFRQHLAWSPRPRLLDSACTSDSLCTWRRHRYPRGDREGTVGFGWFCFVVLFRVLFQSLGQLPLPATAYSARRRPPTLAPHVIACSTRRVASPRGARPRGRRRSSRLAQRLGPPARPPCAPWRSTPYHQPVLGTDPWKSRWPLAEPPIRDPKNLPCMYGAGYTSWLPSTTL